MQFNTFRAYFPQTTWSRCYHLYCRNRPENIERTRSDVFFLEYFAENEESDIFTKFCKIYQFFPFVFDELFIVEQINVSYEEKVVDFEQTCFFLNSLSESMLQCSHMFSRKHSKTHRINSKNSKNCAREQKKNSKMYKKNSKVDSRKHKKHLKSFKTHHSSKLLMQKAKESEESKISTI